MELQVTAADIYSIPSEKSRLIVRRHMLEFVVLYQWKGYVFLTGGVDYHGGIVMMVIVKHLTFQYVTI